MRIYDTKTKLDGEQALAREVLKILPLISKHFEPFNGERAAIKSGRSAAFDKVCKAFREECATLTDARIIVDDQYSVWVKIDINRLNKDKTGSYYFDKSIYCGTISNFSYSDEYQLFKYEFNQPDMTNYCNLILQVTEQEIKEKAAQVAELKKQIDSIQGSVPYIFKELISG